MWLPIFVPEIYAKHTVGTLTITRKTVITWWKLATISQINKWKITSAHSCHDIAVAVLTVQGPSQDIEKTEKIIKIKAES